VTAELLFSYFKIHLQLREGHALLHMVWDFVWELSFSVVSSLKKCEATVAKKKKKIRNFGKEREGVNSQKLRYSTCFGQAQRS